MYKRQAKDVNLENAKSRYGYVPEGFQKLKNDIENKKNCLLYTSDAADEL
ncbi:hypothetical protein JMUB7522_27220 [Staphylococcus aureus]